ncbi:MAG TPA: acyl-CoA thioesterase [Candidatus Polarisedimenticolia bacterium]|nr:acyl-CoA thioesterase [Candidatus Polarisedimenticolia bacterium]
MTDTLEGKPASASRVTMTELVIPEDTNPQGNIFGGRVMALIDKAAAIVGMRHCKTQIATASVDGLTFHSPVRLGSIVILEGRIHNVFRSSMEIGVRVESEDPFTGKRRHTTTAFVTVVAIDPRGVPIPAPPLLLETDEDLRLAQEASERRAYRLRNRPSM